MRLIESVFIWTFILFLTIELFPGIATAQKHQEDESKKNVDQSPIRFILNTPRKNWRANEPIEVLAYLENVSQNKYFYVGRELGSLFSIDPYHYIELSIKDAKNRNAPIGRMALRKYILRSQ